MPDQPTDATLELLERLVAIDSTSALPNAPVIDACAERLVAAGAAVERVASGDEDGKFGLLARVGPDVDGGVVLSGHTDCVPVTGQPWTTDPFTMVARDGVLVGRGTTDMKGFVAAAVASAAPAAAAADLARPLWFLLTWDEEVGCVGSRPMTEALLARTRPAAAVVGEPTSMLAVNAHKGVRSFTVEVAGRDGHSSKPHLAANALVAAARLAVHIDELADAHREAAAAPDFDPPYTTFNVATLHAGQAINIVPRRATLQFEYRPVPADDDWGIVEQLEAWAEEELLPVLREVEPDANVTFERGPFAAGLAPEQDGAAEGLVRALLGDDGPARTVPFGTDGGWHQQGGVSTVVCGPGDIEQAHQPDEWLDPAQLASCEAFLGDLVTHLESR